MCLPTLDKMKYETKKRRCFSYEKQRLLYMLITVDYANNDQVPQGIRAKIKINPRM